MRWAQKFRKLHSRSLKPRRLPYKASRTPDSRPSSVTPPRKLSLLLPASRSSLSVARPCSKLCTLDPFRILCCLSARSLCQSGINPAQQCQKPWPGGLSAPEPPPPEALNPKTPQNPRHAKSEPPPSALNPQPSSIRQALKP